MCYFEYYLKYFYSHKYKYWCDNKIYSKHIYYGIIEINCTLPQRN